MNKAAIVAALEEFGVLLELDGANTFKVRAFENAARALEAAPFDDLGAALANGDLDKIKGIGASIRSIIGEFLQTGKCAEMEELRAKTPAGLMKVIEIPGFGPKKARKAYEELKIDSIEKLRAACEDGTLAKVKGFGAKTTENILKGIVYRESAAGRHRLDEATKAAEPILAFLRGLPQVKRAEAAGSLRRFKETVHDLDFVADTDDPKAVMDAFVAMDPNAEVLGHGETKSSVRLSGGMQADLRCVNGAQFPHALQHFTGSKEHNVEIRSRAKKLGLKVNEYGLFHEGGDKDGESIACADEAAIYKALGLAYIAPELREAQGEIEAAEKKKLPKLLEEKDLRGILHCHSTYSDGAATLREMAEGCRAMGMQYLGICDHSQTAAYAGGLTPDKVRRQWEEVDEINEEYRREKIDFRVLKGIEADILPTGDLDYHDAGDLLKGFDLVVGSVHSVFGLSEAEQTKRVLSAMENPAMTILGHWTGRLLLKREGFKIDHEAVLEQAAKLGIAIEVNATPERLEIDWRFGKRANALGVKTSINPDAHSVKGMRYIRYGTGIARKGWFEAKSVINTWTADEVVAFAKKRWE